MDKLLILKRELSVRKYSQNTIATYVSCAEVIVKKLGEYPGIDAVKDFLITIKNRNSHAQYVSAIRHYFNLALRSKIDLSDIPYPRKGKSLPKYLSQSEVKALLDIPKNVKHQVIISILYGCGLRISELINLKLVDIDRSNMLILVRGGKGQKDRTVMLDAGLLELLEKYYRIYKPIEYVLNGQGNSLRYSDTSINALLKTWAKRAGIKKPVSAHVLRHSFATHLLDTGTDMSQIAKLMGHNNTKTTEIYAQISTRHIKNIRSPLASIQ